MVFSITYFIKSLSYIKKIRPDGLFFINFFAKNVAKFVELNNMIYYNIISWEVWEVFIWNAVKEY